MNEYAFTNWVPNFSLMASTIGCDHGSGAGPLGFGGGGCAPAAAGGLGSGGVAGLGGGGGVGGVAGVSGCEPDSAGFSVLWFSFSSATSDRKSTRLNSSHSQISYAVFCL